MTRKRFSEKTKVAFTNRTVFILDLYIYITKPVWSHVLASSAWTLKKAHLLPINLSPDDKYMYMHASQIPHNKAFPSKTTADCIRYIIGVFCYKFESQTDILASY